MKTCESCGHELGTSGRCKECLKYRLENDATRVDDDSAKRAKGSADDWLEGRGKSAPTKLFNAVKLFAALIGDYFNGSYREIPWPTIAALVTAIVYIVNPLDLIPDFVPFVGYVDDALVLGLIFMAARHDLTVYCLHKGWSPNDYGLDSTS